MTPHNFVVLKAVENSENSDDRNCKSTFVVEKLDLPQVNTESKWI